MSVPRSDAGPRARWWPRRTRSRLARGSRPRRRRGVHHNRPQGRGSAGPSAIARLFRRVALAERNTGEDLDFPVNLGESLQIGGVKTEEVGLIGCFNDKAVGQFNHRLAPRFSGSLLLSGRPGRFRWALPSIRDSRAEAKESHEI